MVYRLAVFSRASSKVLMPLLWGVKVFSHFSWGDWYVQPKLGSVYFVGKSGTNMNVHW